MAQPKKTGLGKGLDALFGGVSINEQPQYIVTTGTHTAGPMCKMVMLK